MSSSSVNRGGGTVSRNSQGEESEKDRIPPDDDEGIEILEVVGMEEDPGVPSDPEKEAAEPSEGSPAADGDGEPRSQVERLREQLLRSRADFDNFRKRSTREMEQLRSRAMADLMERILPVLDNLDRALASESAEDDALRHGVLLIQNQLTEILKREGLAPVRTEGESFDPNLHEAMEMVDDGRTEQGRIVQELQKGYTLGARLLRPAMVRVASGSKPATKDSGDKPAT